MIKPGVFNVADKYIRATYVWELNDTVAAAGWLPLVTSVRRGSL